MRYLDKEFLVNEILSSQPNWKVTDGYMMKAIEKVDPIINQLESRAKNALMDEIKGSTSLSEIWTEQLKNMRMPDSEHYVDGYNQAVADMKKQMETYHAYIENVIDRGLNKY